MYEFPKEIMKEVGEMLAGYRIADLQEKMGLLCRVTQFLLEKGYEELWVSVCAGPNDAILNVAIIKSNQHAEALEKELLADAVSIDADSEVVVNDAWWVPSELIDPSCADLSIHPERREALMVTAKHHSQRLTGVKPFVRKGDDLIFSDLIVEPISDSGLGNQQFATAAWWGNQTGWN